MTVTWSCWIMSCHLKNTLNKAYQKFYLKNFLRWCLHSFNFETIRMLVDMIFFPNRRSLWSYRIIFKQHMTLKCTGDDGIVREVLEDGVWEILESVTSDRCQRSVCHVRYYTELLRCPTDKLEELHIWNLLIDDIDLYGSGDFSLVRKAPFPLPMWGTCR